MLTALLIAAAAATSVPSTPVRDCGAVHVPQSGGDYTDPRAADRLKVVEAYHFTADVESLRHGASGPLGGDLGYTLEHFPNHHRALAALVRLSIREQNPRPHGAHYSTECYFDRALRFSSADTQVRRVYADFLLATRRDEDALAQLEKVVASDPNDARSHYNAGLLCVRKKDWVRATAHASEAYRLGFPLPGLRNKLAEAGHPLPAIATKPKEDADAGRQLPTVAAKPKEEAAAARGAEAPPDLQE